MRSKLILVSLLLGLAVFADAFVRLMITTRAADFRLFDGSFWAFLEFTIGIALLNWLDRWMSGRGRKQHTVAYYVRLYLLGGTGFVAIGVTLIWMVEFLAHGLVPLADWYREARVLATQLYFYLLFANTYLLVRYFQQESEIQLRLQISEKERAQAELRVLQQHINPHFLFNNLNVLSALIEPATTSAHRYLAHFSALYRYLLQHYEQDVVTLHEELAFVGDFMALLRIRFGAAYDFQQSVAHPELLTQGLIPPAVVQELLHNAGKHNDASPTRPLTITLTVTETMVEVRNDWRPGSAPAVGTGAGLNSLRARVGLLTKVPVEVEQTAHHFAVRVPVTRLVTPAAA